MKTKLSAEEVRQNIMNRLKDRPMEPCKYDTFEKYVRAHLDPFRLGGKFDTFGEYFVHAVQLLFILAGIIALIVLALLSLH